MPSRYKFFAVIICTAILFLSFNFASCRRSSSGGANATFETAKDNAVVFSYKDTEITKKQIMDEVQKILPDNYEQDTKTMTPEEVQNIMNEFIIQAYKTLKAQLLFEIYSEDKGISLSEEEVQATVDKFKQRIESNWENAEFTFEEVLEKYNISYETFLIDMRKQALQDKVMQPIYDEIETSEEELQEFFEKNADKYNQEQGAHLHIISFDSRVKADKALAEIFAGADFHEIARQNMPPEQIKEGPVQPGDAGPVPVSNMPPQLVEEILNTQRPLMTPFIVSLNEGQEVFFILRVKELIPEIIRSLDDPIVREAVYEQLLDEKRFHKTEAFIQDLMKVYIIKEHIPPPPSAYNQMMQQMPPAP